MAIGIAGALAAVGTVASAAGTIYGISQQQKAASAAKQAADAQAKAAEIRNQQAMKEAIRRRAQAIKEARLARGSIAAASGSLGVRGTPVQGAISGVTGQIASNVSFANQQFQLEQQRQGFLNTATEFGSQAAAYQANAQLGQGIGSGISSLTSGISKTFNLS